MSGIFTSKGRYALRVMADLATHDGWVSLGDISKRQNISRKYLEQVITLMRNAGFVESQRGKSGGYKLSHDPSEYTLSQIIIAAEGADSMTICSDCNIEGSGGEPCPNACDLASVWQDIESLTASYLGTKTLADVVSAQHSKKPVAG
ncbi:MAG: RrF2 family transcriptional regulator [Coriobacteriales bacterium]|jgi:Rrf2 family iron-sulfur cluster assembly transcriptional regulator